MDDYSLTNRETVTVGPKQRSIFSMNLCFPEIKHRKKPEMALLKLKFGTLCLCFWISPRRLPFQNRDYRRQRKVLKTTLVLVLLPNWVVVSIKIGGLELEKSLELSLVLESVTRTVYILETFFLDFKILEISENYRYPKMAFLPPYLSS